jgi:hypothetical protein
MGKTVVVMGAPRPRLGEAVNPLVSHPIALCGF